MIHRAVLGILPLFLLPHLLVAQGTVRSLDVVGNEAFSRSDILSWLSTRPDARYLRSGVESDIQAIRERYRDEGFLGASVTLAPERWNADSTTVALDIIITEGKRTRVASLTFTGNQVLGAEELSGVCETLPGSPLQQRTLERDIDAILGLYDRAGFPLAECRIGEMELQPGVFEDSLHVVVDIREGDKVAIEEIRVEGNRETERKVVVRESRIKLGEPYDPERARLVRERLERLNIFASVDDPVLYLRDGKGGLLLRVREGNTNSFDGILGYIPGGTPGESGYVTGFVAVGMRNLFGTGRKLSVRWQKEDRLTQDLNIGYLEPWLFGWPLNLGGDFQQRRQDSTYVRQVVRGKVEVMLSQEMAFGVLASVDGVIPSEDSLVTVPRSTTVFLGGDLQYDSRNDLYSATAGSRYRADYHYGRKTVQQSPEAAAVSSIVQKYSVDLETYLTVFSRQVIAAAVHGRQMTGDDIDPSEMFRFGGATTLRGFRENQFVGTGMLWTNFEYRFLLARRSFFYGFFDTGYYFRPAGREPGQESVSELKYGYGIGLRFDTALGNLGVSFAFGKGDSFAQGKIHVSIANEF